MICPVCKSCNVFVIETRGRKTDNIVYRRRRCRDCEYTFRTYEMTYPDLKKMKNG